MVSAGLPAARSIFITFRFSAEGSAENGDTLNIVDTYRYRMVTFSYPGSQPYGQMPVSIRVFGKARAPKSLSPVPRP